MHLLSEQTLSSKDFADKMRELWDDENYDKLFTVGCYYPYGSNAICDKNIYLDFNHASSSADDSGGLLQQIEEKLKDKTEPLKHLALFLYRQFGTSTIVFDPTAIWAATGTTDDNGNAIYAVTADRKYYTDTEGAAVANGLVMFECKSQYFISEE